MQISGQECSRQRESTFKHNSKKAGVAGMESKEREIERGQGQTGTGGQLMIDQKQAAVLNA